MLAHINLVEGMSTLCIILFIITLVLTPILIVGEETGKSKRKGVIVWILILAIILILGYTTTSLISERSETRESIEMTKNE